jgi:hypothetical protein
MHAMLMDRFSGRKEVIGCRMSLPYEHTQKHVVLPTALDDQGRGCRTLFGSSPEEGRGGREMSSLRFAMIGLGHVREITPLAAAQGLVALRLRTGR